MQRANALRGISSLARGGGPWNYYTGSGLVCRPLGRDGVLLEGISVRLALVWNECLVFGRRGREYLLF